MDQIDEVQDECQQAGQELLDKFKSKLAKYIAEGDLEKISAYAIMKYKEGIEAYFDDMHGREINIS
jgi:hypothetical protein